MEASCYHGTWSVSETITENVEVIVEDEVDFVAEPWLVWMFLVILALQLVATLLMCCTERDFLSGSRRFQLRMPSSGVY